jgi:hypothetical protein
MKKKIVHLFLFFLLIFSSKELHARKWYVDDGSNIGDVFTSGSIAGNDITGDGSAIKPYAKLIKAISSAVSMDTIFVDKGTYSDNQVLFSKALTIIGAGTGNTIFDGRNTNRQFGRITFSNVILKNFTITKYYNDISTQGQVMDINGVYNDVIIENVIITGTLGGTNTLPNLNVAGGANVVIRNCFFKCSGYNGATGGGVMVNGASLKVDNCVFKQNKSAINFGGAVAITGNSDVTVSNSSFYECQSKMGGAIGQDGGVLSVTGSCFEGNYSNEDVNASGGGAIWLSGSATAIFTDCSFTNNSARNNEFLTEASSSDGGAVYMKGSSITFNNCSFQNNSTGPTSSSSGEDLCLGSGVMNLNNCRFESNLSSYPSDFNIYKVSGDLTTLNSGVPNINGVRSISSNPEICPPIGLVRTEVFGISATGWTDVAITNTTQLDLKNLAVNGLANRTSQSIGNTNWTDQNVSGGASNIIMVNSGGVTTYTSLSTLSPVPAGWTSSFMSGTSTPYLANNGGTSSLKTSTITVSGVNPHIYFQTFDNSTTKNSTIARLDIQISKDGGVTFTTIKSITNNTASTQYVTIPLTGYLGQNVQIRFVAPNAFYTNSSTYGGPALDEIFIRTITSSASESFIETPSMNLSTQGYQNLLLSYQGAFQGAYTASDAYKGQLYVEKSLDGGITWTALSTNPINTFSSATLVPFMVDVSSLIGQSNVKLRFKAPFGDGSKGVQLKNITVYGITQYSEIISPNFNITDISTFLTFDCFQIGSIIRGSNVVSIDYSNDFGQNWIKLSTRTSIQNQPIDISFLKGENIKLRFKALGADGINGVALDNIKVIMCSAMNPVGYPKTSCISSESIDCNTIVNCATETLAPIILNCVRDKSITGCAFTLPDYTSEVSAYDDCSFIITQNPPAGTTLSSGNKKVTFTVTDSHSNSSTCSMVVSVTGCGCGTAVPTVGAFPGSICKIDNITVDSLLTYVTYTGTPHVYFKGTGVLKEIITPFNSTYLDSGSYYITQTIGCESEDSLKITVNIRNPATPTTASTKQNFCQIDKKLVSDLDPSGADINWYKLSNPGVQLNTTDLLVTGDYYARRQTGSCESDDSLKITVNVSNPSTPMTTSTTQNFCQIDQKHISDLDPNGVDITWYKLSSPGVRLSNSELLTIGVYYARRQVGSCESDDSLKINVTNNSTSASSSIISAFGNGPLCSNSTAKFKISKGTGGETVKYTINGGSEQSVVLKADGTAEIDLGNQTTTQTIILTKIVSSTGCVSSVTSATKIATIYINPTSTKGAVLAVSGNGPLCYNSTAKFTIFNGTGGESVIYTINGGAEQIVVLKADGTAEIDLGNQTTNQTIELTKLVTASGCVSSVTSVTKTAIININTVSTKGASISVTPNGPFCMNGIGIFTIKNGDQNGSVRYKIDGGVEQTQLLDFLGNATINLGNITSNKSILLTNVVTPLGCLSVITSALATATISIEKHIQSSIIITPQTSTSFCQGGSVDLTAESNGTYTYQWLNNGVGISNSTSATYKATTAGKYSVIVKSNTGCVDTSSVIPVTVTSLATPIITGPAILCYNSKAIFKASIQGGTWGVANDYLLISSPQGLFRNNKMPPSNLYKTGVTYTLTSKDKLCSVTAQKSVWIRNVAATSVSLTATKQTLKVGEEAAATATTKITGNLLYWLSASTSFVSVTGTSSPYIAIIKGLRPSTGANITFSVDDAAKGCRNTAFLPFTVTAAASLVDNESNTTTYTTDLNVYPNPSNGMVTIENIGEAKTISLIDVTGRVLKTTPVNADRMRMDYSNITKGNYFISIQGETLKEMKSIVIE